MKLTTQNPLRQAIDNWLGNQLSKHTKTAYRRDMRDFQRWLIDNQLDDTDSLKAITPEHIISYRRYLDTHYSRASVNRKFSTICSCFQWLEAMRVVLPNPCKHIKAYPQPDNATTEALTDAEAKRMLLVASKNAADSLALKFMLYTGIRVGELVKLTVDDFYHNRDLATVRIFGKGHKVRELPVPKAIQRGLAKYLANVDGKRIFPVHSTTIFRMVKRYAKQAGIDKNISPHSLRATAVSNALELVTSFQVISRSSTNIMEAMSWSELGSTK